jgi:LysM repeat protein
MIRWLMLKKCGVLALMCVLAAGCLPQGSQQDERRESHFLAGISRVNSLDFQGAIESFEKALEVNPRSASAHFELGLLNYQRVNDYAAAIYHFERFMKLRPDDPKVERARECVLACKQEIAKTVDFTPLSPSVQSNLEKLMNDNKQLKAENEQLRAQLIKWSQFYESLQQQQHQQGQSIPQAATETVVQRPYEPVVAQPVEPAQRDSAASQSGGATSEGPRTHTVQRGETFYSIAQRYGLDVNRLQSANPGVQPTRLQVGQTLRLPGSRP